MSSRVTQTRPPASQTRTQTPGGKQPGTDVAARAPGLVEVFAARYGIEPNKMLDTLKNTAFNTGKKDGKPNPPATNEEMAALLVVANEYHLNPFTKEIYAFRNQNGGITPIVGFDGWIRLVQKQPQFDGEELIEGYDERPGPDGKPMGLFYDCLMYRKDRRVPTKVREYYFENYRNTDPWNTMPNRMTRMRSYIQCARICFGFGGVYDEDEGQKISLAEHVDYLPRTPKVEAPVATSAQPTKITEDQLESLKELLAKTGVPDNDVLNKFDLTDLEDILFDRYADVVEYVQSVAP